MGVELGDGPFGVAILLVPKDHCSQHVQNFRADLHLRLQAQNLRLVVHVSGDKTAHGFLLNLMDGLKQHIIVQKPLSFLG